MVKAVDQALKIALAVTGYLGHLLVYFGDSFPLKVQSIDL